MVFSLLQRGLFGLRLLSPIISGQFALSFINAVDAARPNYHITPESNWMNDPQRPFFLGGEWHLYYLFNADFNEANPRAGGGTSWYHVTSTDLVHWTRRSVAIDKYKPNENGVYLGDIESGSAVVDTQNTAGFGNNAVVALATQGGNGIQQQSLFYATDNGYRFTPAMGNPMMPNPNPSAKADFRDPKVIWDAERNQWVMTLGEGNKIGFYTSPNLRNWIYVSGFIPQNSGVDLGLLECPDLYQLDVDGDPNKRTWVLAAGANGYRYSRTTGTAYWLGSFDGRIFTTSQVLPQWMDDGPDFYATVTWSDPRLTGNAVFASRYAIGWMNNWDYANDLPYYGGWAGQQSIVRDIKLKTVGGAVRLVNSPISGYANTFGTNSTVNGKSITMDPATASLPAMPGGAYMIRTIVSKKSGDNGDEVRIRIKGGGSFSTTIGFNFGQSQAFLVRDNDGSATDAMGSAPKSAYDAIRTATIPMSGNSVALSIYVDWNSVEVFINGVASLSGLIYPNAGSETIQMVTGVGSLSLDTFMYANTNEA
ncbi:glycosyl hydrolase [Rhexocercosporidium sp. MPI-PUGE-AT-0058]|nr:glycosyl hydrolase [Rhexocercosporidium sp. MPI-PUGE-AT-0058]